MRAFLHMIWTFWLWMHYWSLVYTGFRRLKCVLCMLGFGEFNMGTLDSG